jgi:hypothetical protein
MSRESLFVSLLLLLALGVVWQLGPDRSADRETVSRTAEVPSDLDRDTDSPVDGTPGDLVRALSASDGLRFEESVTGSAVEAVRASTIGTISGEAGDLYLTAITTKPAEPVGGVEGMGLDWFPVRTQCSARGTTAVSLWAATADAAVTGPVMVELDAAPANISIATARYSGADIDVPIGAIAGANTNQSPDDCVDGVDGSRFEIDLEPTAPGSLTVVVAATRQRTLLQGSNLSGRSEVHAGMDGGASGLAFGDNLPSSSVDVGVDGSAGTSALFGEMSGKTDWAALAVEILPSGFSPLAPTLRIMDLHIDFGSTPPITSVASEMGRRTVELRNDGLTDLAISDVSLAGPDADQFRLTGSDSFVLEHDADHDIVVEFWPTRAENASAELRVTSNDPTPPANPVLTGRGGTQPDGIWISASELAAKPMSGKAWERLLATADGDLGKAHVSDFIAKHDVRTLAVALVYGRTGQHAYRAKARDAIMSALGTEAGTTTAVQPCRNVTSYVIAADLIGLAEFDPQAAADFRDWIDEIRFVQWPDGSFIDEDEERANNHGRMCGMSRVVIAAYLGDEAELANAAAVFARFLGDTSIAGTSVWRHDLSWQADADNPVGINPVGARKDGLSIDGALPEEMRRGGPFQVPPMPTSYPWEGLQGAVVEAVVLDRAGYDVFDWSDQAILRAVEFLARLDQAYPDDGWWAVADDTWVPWVVNDTYGTTFPTDWARLGKAMGWTDWSHDPP